MSETATKTRLTEVTLTPLNADPAKAKTLVLFGLRTERVSFRVNSPSKRNVGQGTITQQRRVGRRRYTLEFTLFEQNITKRAGSDGRRKGSDRAEPMDVVRPAHPSVYSTDADKAILTTKDQLDLIHLLAKLHEEGALLAYKGIIVNVPKAAIVEFDASAVYTTGTGTITIEERPEVSFDLHLRAVAVEAVEQALIDLQGTTTPTDMDGTLAAAEDGTLTRDQHRRLVQAMLVQSVTGRGGGAVFSTSTDKGYLATYGLSCLPLIVANTNTEQRQILPSDPNATTPLVAVVPLADPLSRGLAGVQSRFDLSPFQPEFTITVNYEGFYIVFRFDQSILDSSWTVEAQVFLTPQSLNRDTREDVTTQTDPSCAPPPPRQLPSPDPNKPAYVTKQKVVFGSEWNLADKLTFCFVGRGGKNPFQGRKSGLFSTKGDIPRGAELREFALVIADYA